VQLFTVQHDGLMVSSARRGGWAGLNGENKEPPAMWMPTGRSALPFSHAKPIDNARHARVRRAGSYAARGRRGT
jgi:hypothetical protein